MKENRRLTFFYSPLQGLVGTAALALLTLSAFDSCQFHNGSPSVSDCDRAQVSLGSASIIGDRLYLFPRRYFFTARFALGLIRRWTCRPDCLRGSRVCNYAVNVKSP